MQLTSATDRAGLAEEQAALRRVATLVAEQPPPQEVFTAVTEAVGPLLGNRVGLGRDEAEQMRAGARGRLGSDG